MWQKVTLKELLVQYCGGRSSPKYVRATPSNCGKFLKPLILTHRGNIDGGQGNDLGYSKNSKDVTMDNPQPSSKSFKGIWVQFTD